MKTRIYIFLLAAMALLAGCNKELQEIETPAGQTGNAKTFLKIGIDTKTHLGESESGLRKVYWSNGDMISVNGNASDELENIEEGATSATFSFSGTLTPPYRVIYPAGIYSEAIILPAIQDYKEGGFADNLFPMSGYSADGSDITLSHLCAIVKISVLRAQAPGSDEDDLVSVRFKGRNDEQVSGIFRIDFENATISSESSAAEDKVVKVIKTLSTSTTTPVDYYIVVPAGTYANGFDVIVQDRNGHIMTKSKTDSKTLEAGHLYNMPEFEFVPTATELGIEISSAQDLIDFATAYNAKDYADLGSTLVATVTADLSFDATTSAAFNATGGIGLKEGINGNEDVYFNGIFNGNGKTISGLAATVPLFVAIGDNGTVKDLTIGNTSTFTFTHKNTIEAMFASVVGYHKGLLDNVKSAANISLTEAENIAKMTTIGGLAARTTVGHITNSEYSGLISTPVDFNTINKLIVGGLVGRFSNAGSISESNFKGAISNESKIVNADGGSPYYIVGGVAGYVDGGATVSSCNSTADHELIATGYNNFNGIIINKTVKAYNSIAGGIVGELYNGTVSNCTNSANIANYIIKEGGAGATGNASARYMKSGGIAGRVDANGVITDCTNNGAVQHRSNPRLQDVAGIAGYNAGSIRSCTNTAAVSHMTTGVTGITNKGGRIVNLGGIVGENMTGAVVSDVHNTGAVGISAMEDNYDTDNNKPVCEVRIGGVVAYNQAELDGGATKNITNTGEVALTTTPSNEFIGFEIGGIVGLSEGAVKNASNSGLVRNTLNNAYVVSKLYLGGVVGLLSNKTDIAISGCENSGEVYFNINGKAAAHTGDYVGGIIGLASGDGVTASVSDCANSGYVHINCNIATAVNDLIVAGVVAKMGESGTISNCSNVGGENNAGELDIAFSNAAHTNNCIGGILGKTASSNLAISNCTNSGYIHGGNPTKQNGTSCYVGGIAAYLDGESSIADCTNSGNVYNNHSSNSTGTNNTAFSGGIAGWVSGTADKAVNISGCEHKTFDFGPRRGYGGGIVGYSNYAVLQNNSVTAINLTGSGYFLGGIAGWAVNSSLENCKITGTSISSSQIQRAGGIVAKLGAESILDGCSSSINTITGPDAAASGITYLYGAIAGESVAGSTIKNCKWPASGTITGGGATHTWKICGDSNFTDGGGNVTEP